MRAVTAKRVRSEPTSGKRGGFCFIMDETYLENDPLSFQILRSLRGVRFAALPENERRDFSFLTMICASLTLGVQPATRTSMGGKVEFVPFSSTGKDMFVYEKFSGKNLFGEG